MYPSHRGLTCAVHQDQPALARAYTPRDLVAEVDVTGRVDQIDEVLLSVLWVRVDDGYSLCFDGNPAFALDFELVEELRVRRGGYGAGHLSVSDGDVIKASYSELT